MYTKVNVKSKQTFILYNNANKNKTQHMKFYEYQAKALFSKYNIPVEKSVLCHTFDEVPVAYADIGIPQVVIKAQVLTGGRGKAGGVKLARSKDEARNIAKTIFGMNIKGFFVDRVLVSEAVDIVSEYYLSLTIDRNTRSIVLIASREGGMEIEVVSRTMPNLICHIPVDASIGMQDFLSKQAAFFLFDNPDLIKQCSDIIQKLYQLFIENDASLVEINPLALTKDGNLVAVDAKITFDDNALFRHPDIENIFEPNIEEQKERIAKEKGFSYVGLDGNIGCMVNGAGLAMATMDMIKHFGGNPANFLDIGGSSNPDKTIEAVKFLLSDFKVKVVLINIFGGITRCDDIAKGLLKAFEQTEIKIPVIIRLSGTNEQKGQELLKDTPFIIAKTMEEAAKAAIQQCN